MDDKDLIFPDDKSKDDIYDQMKMSESERDVEIDLPQNEGDGSSGRSKSLSEAEDSPNITDLQATLKRLFPIFEDDEINKIKAVMVARIAPDTFMPLLKMTIISILESHEEDEDIDVMSTINLVNAILTIGLEGKGRVDALQLASAARESAELENVSKSLGF